MSQTIPAFVQLGFAYVGATGIGVTGSNSNASGADLQITSASFIYKYKMMGGSLRQTI